jgi:Tol biopolymer transport system component
LSAGGTYFGDEHDYGPVPHWSPSGRYVAFHDFLEWEVKTSLWVARPDGSELRALVDNRSKESDRALKAFVWHPVEDRILFVNGYAWGAAPSGGDVYTIDMEGNSKMVVGRTNTRQNLSGPLRVEDGYLHYHRMQFDENYNNPTISEERVPLAGL